MFILCTLVHSLQFFLKKWCMRERHRVTQVERFLLEESAWEKGGREEKPAPGDRSGRREERGRKRVRDTEKQAERQKGEKGRGGRPTF